MQDLGEGQRSGRPEYAGPVHPSQAWIGTDRQCRGAILAVLRASKAPVPAAGVSAAWLIDDTQRARCLDSLVADGLAEPVSGERYRLPGR